MSFTHFYRNLIIMLFLGLSSYAAEAQTKIAGISLPKTLTVDKNQLILNGAGIRVKYFMDMYVGGLYLPEKNSDANKIINANEPMVIRIHVVSGLITSQKMEDAINEGFKNSTNGNITPIKTQIATFTSAFKEEIRQNDIFDIVYSNNKITVLKNNQLKSNIQGLDFKKALFGIWLSEKPADENLKKGMLGMKK